MLKTSEPEAQITFKMANSLAVALQAGLVEAAAEMAKNNSFQRLSLSWMVRRCIMMYFGMCKREETIRWMVNFALRHDIADPVVAGICLGQESVDV